MAARSNWNTLQRYNTFRILQTFSQKTSQKENYMTKKERMEALINHYADGKPTKFARFLGVAPSTVSTWLNRGTLDYDFIFAKCEALSPEWLLTGEGEMLKTKRISRQNSVEQVPVVEYKDSEFSEVNQSSDLRDIPTRPRIPVDAAAGSLSVALSSVAESDCEQIPVIPTLPKYDFTIVARGDSMTPDILPGDELACRFINEKGFIQWGRTHVLDTAQGVVVKRIFDADDNIICRSANHNYPDFPVSKNEIYHLALVVGLLRQI